MLNATAPFPHPGSTAFLRGTADKVTVIQRNADATALVKVHPPRFMTPAERDAWRRRGASLTRTVEVRDLYDTPLKAQFCGRPPRGRR